MGGRFCSTTYAASVRQGVPMMTGATLRGLNSNTDTVRNEPWWKSSGPASRAMRGETDIDWDSQQTVERQGKPVRICACGHEWGADIVPA